MDKKKKILVAVGIVAFIALIHFAYQFFMYATTDNAQIEAHTVMLAPRVAGYVRAVHVTEGQRVKAGEVLVEIDARDYQNALQVAKSELLSLEARRTDAERNYRRISDLFKQDAVSRQQYDQATASYNEVKARYDAAQAQVAQAQLNLENTQLKAPSDGFIARKSVDVGQLAAVGVPLLGFVDGQERWVIANFKETDLEDIRAGRAVDVDVDAIPGRDFHGVVHSISAATGATFTLLPPDNATGNFTKVVQRVPVRIKLENLSADDIEQLRAGLSAFVKVHKR
jgi:membrane fusion protein (multidrug efflux system)